MCAGDVFQASGFLFFQPVLCVIRQKQTTLIGGLFKPHTHQANLVFSTSLSYHGAVWRCVTRFIVSGVCLSSIVEVDTIILWQTDTESTLSGNVVTS